MSTQQKSWRIYLIPIKEICLSSWQLWCVGRDIWRDSDQKHGFFVYPEQVTSWRLFFIKDNFYKEPFFSLHLFFFTRSWQAISTQQAQVAATLLMPLQPPAELTTVQHCQQCCWSCWASPASFPPCPPTYATTQVGPMSLQVMSMTVCTERRI